MRYKLTLSGTDAQPPRLATRRARDAARRRRHDSAAVLEAIHDGFEAMAVAGRCPEARAIAGRHLAYPLATASHRARERALSIMAMYQLGESARETWRVIDQERAEHAALNDRLMRNGGEGADRAG